MTYQGQEKPTLEDVVHFGVKGMKWGVRRDNYVGASAAVNGQAKKDAHEFARAKMFTGEGAGNRRKLIKATVEARSKSDPSYKAAFDHHLAKQDMADHAAKAQSERKRKDVVKGTAKTARGVRHILNGNSQYASLAAAMAVGGYMYAKRTGIDQMIKSYAQTTMKNMRTNPGDRSSGMSGVEFLRSMGVVP